MPRDEAIRWLIAQANPDGTWGYLPGQPGRAEPTTYALAALRSAGLMPTGGWGPSIAWLEGADPAELAYTELLLPTALASIPEARALCERSIERMLGRTQLQNPLPEDLFSHDGQLLGWGWLANTASWVEPTSYAILSLKRWGHADDPRVRTGEALLRDRVCHDGGWNYGNPRVLEERLESDPVCTAWAAMAIGRDPLVPAALELLRAHCLNEPSALNGALTILARTAHGAPVDDIVPALLGRQSADGSFRSRVELTALAILALGAIEEGEHVFAHAA